MSIYKELSYEQDVDTINGIQFSIMSADDIRNRSVAEILTTDTYAGVEPVHGGLFDPRMGVVDHNKICPTCEQKNKFCPGHFGHIELAKPLFYIQFFDIVKKLMKCVCFKCSKLLLDKEQPELQKIMNKKISRQKKFDAIYKICSKNKIKWCGSNSDIGCGARQPDKISKDNIGKIILEWKDLEEDNKKIYLAEDVLKILTRITDEDSAILGFPKKINRPENLICTVFPFPPPTVRPSVRNDTGQRCHDDLTHKLCDMVKTNNTLKAKIDKGTATIEQIEYWTILLQYHLSTFIDNKIPGIAQAKQRTGRPLRSLTERLKSKEGRIRGNLMGKRVDFSARSVITPDPCISINELGVPIKIAMNLTYPEKINKYNREKLIELVKNGPDKYPGAKYLRKANENMRTIRLKDMDFNKLTFEDGDIVDRHVMNGDFVLFNRQPSLHKMSMMSHKVRVMPYDTFRLNPAVTPSYNADYDGDEMNLHLPQSVQTENELKMLSNVTSQIVSPRESKPIISVVQDVTLGLYRLTKDNVEITEKQLFNLLMTNSKFIGDVPEPNNDNKWSGRDILSEIIPSNVNLKNGNNQYDSDKNKNDKQNFIVIENGKIKQGVFDKKIYQDRTNGLVHILFNDNGQDEARYLFDNTQKLICNWLVYNGFSVGVSDLIVTQKINDEMEKEINDMKTKVYKIMKDIHQNKFENKSFESNKQNFENEVNNLLNNSIGKVGKIALKNITDENRMVNMIKSKSKGNPVNMAQMISSLGQQNVDGRRITDSYNDRTLPHYTKYDDGPESRGFVENSFINGLTPQEFYFHAMGGREGLIDTAVKSITGDTPIIIIENDIPKKVNIGDWIDNHLEINKKDIKYYDEKEANMELLDIENNDNLKVVIPTTDNIGNMSWEKITKITRHDPSELIYIIKTKAGRSVKVVESKSLLIWNSDIEEYKPTLTTDVNIGDYVPISYNLSNKNVKQINYINMEDYLPKDEYIYGTDFNIAMKLIIDKDRRLPTFWWSNNNGKEFMLPYNHAHSLLRVEKRSNIDIIKDNYIYPYRGVRSEAKIEDKLELNRENGVFLGIYLAEGNSHITSGKVMICNNNPEILGIIKKWFDKRSIVNKIYTKNIKNTTSTTIQGYSVVLAKFLSKFVGKTSRNKFIPSEFYLAPDEFIIGLLDGYFSGDGHITKNSIELSSASYELIEGISMLLTRFGIFSKITFSKLKSNNFGTTDIAPINRLAIRSKFALKFSKIIKLSHPDKFEKLNNLLNSETILKYEKIYEVKKDTILDEIISIEKISSKEYPKVYDLTIPATKNFGLSNGLQVYDTSETGYIQRQLIKGMEDCKINYDLTVRNATGAIVQFLYGEDGMNATKLENQSLKFLEMDINELEKAYLFRADDCVKNLFKKSIFNNLMDDLSWENKCYDLYKEILDDRDYLITKLFKNQYETSILYPVSIRRIINNAVNLYHKKKTQTDLTPIYIINKINELSETLILNENNKGNKLLNILLKIQLSPKQIIVFHRLNKLSFEYVINQIRIKFMEAIAHPSEMVGVVAAQSIGEPCTQLTLNSVEYNTPILLDINGKFKKVKIGEYIDKRIKNANEDNIENHPNDTTLEYIIDDKVKVLAPTEDGKIIWDNVKAVTKHPVINKDGSSTLLKVTTHSNRVLIATKAKGFMKRVNNKIVGVTGDELKIGDYIPISNILKLNEDNLINKWDITEYLPKNEYLYTSEVKKALELYDSKKHIKSSWWKPNKGNIFELPYSRGDGFIEAYRGSNRTDGKPKRKFEEKENCIYPCKVTKQPAHIPEEFELDELFGFFIGAYMAEGCCTKHHILIANLDNDFNEKIDKFCNKYSINYHIDDNNGKIKNNGYTKTLRLHSLLLAQILLKSIGTGSSNKIFPSMFLQAPDEFLKGLIDGYFSGDGTIGKSEIIATSVSKELIEGIQAVLIRFNIQSSVKPYKKSQEISIKNDYNAKLPYNLYINCEGKQIFRDTFNLTIKYKNEKLKSYNSNEKYGRLNMIPNVVLSSSTKNIKRNDLQKIKNSLSNEQDIKVIEDIENEEIWYDRIIKIEEFESEHPYVYDFTTDITKNFTDYYGSALRDTFHSAGISAASQTVRGVPRIKELLRLSKNIKGPSTKVYINENVNKDKKKCKDIKNSLETTYIKDIIKSSSIYYDPSDVETTLDNDKEFIKIYKQYEEDNCTNSSPWLLRFVFDNVKMYDLGITMNIIHHTISKKYEEHIECYFSDDNADKLIFRIRLIENDNSKLDINDMITELKALEQNILENIIIKGINNVKKVILLEDKSMSYDTNERKFKKTSDKYYIVTNGNNLLDILTHPDVDSTLTISNDINEVYEIFGIEVTRQVLLDEINEILKEEGVNYRHISLLVDTMTNKGTLLSIDRHGINRSDIGPFAKCSFEETSDMLIKAGVFGEYDRINGVSANIMLGQIPPCGTGDTDILIDQEKLMNVNDIKEQEDINIDSGLCTEEALSFNFDIPINIETKDTKEISLKIV